MSWVFLQNPRTCSVWRMLCVISCLAMGMLFASPKVLGASIAQPEPGVFVVKNLDWSVETLLLEGEWRFFPMELLGPAEARQRIREGQAIRIPGAWNRIPGPDGQPMGAHGFGTYVARLEGLPAQNAALSLRLQYATSNYRLFWLRAEDQDAAALMEAGRVGRSKQESLPQFLEKLQQVSPLQQAEAVWIVVQVSNYHWVEGGMFYAPEVGSSAVMEHSYMGRFIGSLMLSGMFIMLMLYNLSVYLRQRNDAFALWLVLAAAVALLATSTFFSQLFYYAFTPSLHAHQLFRYGQNAFGALVLAVFNQLVYLQYPRQGKRWIARFMWATALIAQFLYAFLPFSIPLPVIRLNQALVLLFPFLVTWQIWLAWRAREENSGLYLLGFAIFFASLINDLLVVFRVLTLPMLSNWGLMVMIFMQTQLLAIKYAQAFAKTRSLSRTLVEWNQSLEQRVALQTREIRSLLTHVKIGIFGLVGRSKKIAKDYSQHLEIIFEEQHLEGRHGLELLLRGSELMQDEVEQIDQVLNACMGEADINFQLNAHVLPTSLKRRDRHGQTHQFELTWDAVPNERGLIEMILVTVNDVTQLRKLESVALRHSVELAMVGEILGIREDEFRRFVVDARELFDHSRHLLQDPGRTDECLRLILIDVHTLKGTARTLHLSRLTEALHWLERNYRGHALSSETATALLHDLNQAFLILQDYETVAMQKLRWDAESSPTVRLKKELLESGFATMKQMLPRLSEEEAAEWQPLFQLLQAVNEIPLEQLLRNVLQILARVAADLGKPTPRLDIEVPAITCNESMGLLLRKIVVHIARNIMDHGIEAPAERSALGKAAAGLISVHGELVDGDIVLRIRDDGRGLDLDELARVHPEAKDLDPAQVANLIFKEGVTTARTVTDISGHGLGMAAVRRFIEEQGGRVQIILEAEGQGSRRAFHLCIRLPLSGFTCNPFVTGTAA